MPQDGDGVISLDEFRAFLRPGSPELLPLGEVAAQAAPKPKAKGKKGGAAGRKNRAAGRVPIAPAMSYVTTPPPPPAAPPSLGPEEVEMITHCAQWVAQHGVQFEAVLRTKNAHQPGWGFLAEGVDSEASSYYRELVTYELAAIQ
eukprot:SAG11_NODE_1138_length_5724_cov_188.276978_5_plen_145_part_00